MPSEITMPQLSDTMTQGVVVKWHKKEGEKVKGGDAIADVETDKATMPAESSESGVLAFVAAKEGQKVQVGGLIAVIAGANEDAGAIRKQYEARGGASSAAPAKAAPAKAQAVAAGAGAMPPTGSTGGATTLEGASIGEMHEPEHDNRHGATRGPAGAKSEPAPQAAHGGGNGEGRLKITPLARRVAADRGIDPAGIHGSGPGGRIVQRDVLEHAEKGGSRQGAAAGVSLAPVILSGQTKVVQMSKMRSAIATALQRSKQNVPHFYLTVDVDVEELSALRERLNQRLEKEKVRLSIADFVNKAVATALTQHPALNARYNAEKGEITQYGDVNLGIAVAIPDGLIVPVLRGANQMGLREIRVRTADLVDRARAQRLKREEMSEATFSISSLGTYGIRDFSAIINPPEVGILAVGAAEKRPVIVHGDQIIIGTVMTVTLSCDHRAVDGATGAEFLRTLKGLLEEPGMMMV